MIKRFPLFIAVSFLFGLEPLSRTWGTLPSAALLVLAGVVFAVAASGAHALAVAAGAAGALAFGLLSPLSAGAAGAAIVALGFGERSLRVRDSSARALHLGLAILGGALAGAISAHHADATLTVRAVVIVVAAVLVALPLLVEADDPVAHGLELLAVELPGEVGQRLHEGAQLRRTVEGPAVEEGLLDADTRRHAAQTWRGLLELATARARLERKPTTAEQRAHGDALRRRLDDRIGAHVTALTRIYTAADEARAAEVSLEDTALRRVESTGESLEEVSRAIVEV